MMGDCNWTVSYSCPKNCKFTYSPWCPTCEISSPRRRSRSETSEPRPECRRKCKEMKGYTPPMRKYTRSQEYENMELEYEVKDGWCQTKDWDCRIRANLCELPTSYITNNCQSKSGDTSDFRQPKPLFTELNHLCSGAPKEPRPMERQLARDVKCRPHTKDNQHCDEYRNCREYCTLVDLKMHNIQDRSLCYDTTTYFNRKDRDHLNLLEKYNAEVEYLRDKLLSLKKTDETQPSLVAKPVEISPKRIKSPNMKLILKTSRSSQRLNNIKMRKQKSKATLRNVAPPQTVESDSSSDSEPEVEDAEAECTSEQSAGEDAVDKKLEEAINEAGSGDAVALDWPLRLSQFPHIPPYLSFSLHDATSPVKFPTGGKFFKWKLTTITPVLVRQTLTNSGFALVRKSNQWTGTWGKHMKSPMFKTLKESQKINHFPGTFQLGRKDRLWRNIQRLISKFGHKEFGFIPHCYVLPHELKWLKQNWEFKNGSGGEMWIIKPPASARGVGIKVINKWSQLPKNTSLVVQKYISNPYLINDSKFDLRLYVLVTSFHPLRIYLYPDGLARFASAKYSDDSKDLKDRYRHLTNYSINKLSDQYTANEDANACQGHKWTISKLMEYLQERGVNSKALWKSLQQLVIKTILAAESPITQLCEENMNSVYNCYELFGVDVLLDADLKPWLLEVNISPSLHSASPLDAHVKGPMVRTLFEMAQFHVPTKVSPGNGGIPPPLNPKLYTTHLTKVEKRKHVQFEQMEARADYLHEILRDLTGDDVRQLVRAEDEYVAKGRFERIFPTAHTHKYMEFMESRYYNRLFDAWETKYAGRRQDGVELLRTLCSQRVHLKTAVTSRMKKSSQSTIPGPAASTKDPQTRPLEEIMKTASLTSEVVVVHS